MANVKRNLTMLSVVIAALAVGAIAWWQLRSNDISRRAAATTPADLPPVRSSPFRNAQPGVAYLGAASCVSCHAEAHASYLETAHSRALAEIDLEREPPDGECRDPRWKKLYRIARRNGQIHHVQSIQTSPDEELVLADFPVRYVIGSGRFSRSYLAEIDGFLYESPATWYAARPGWALSPGFEKFDWGFQRPVELRCLFCHAGRLEPVDNSPQRVELLALAIDCERCHGPGGLHVQKWEQSTDKLSAGEADDTIVNPARLERRLQEDICAQCHLHSAATVELTGRRLLDFRPGQRLADYAVHFGIQTPTEEMQVVGHVEQMRLSRCYQASGKLTCTTCHHLHDKLAERDRAATYRSQCLTCHTEQTCSASHETRFAGDLADNCITCHMPRGDTEIPHFAFTHHRIGIHQPRENSPDSPEQSQLVTLDDVSWQPKLDQERNLGLGYLQFSVAPGQAAYAESHRLQALTLLEQVQRQRPGDAEVEAALARLFSVHDPTKALRFAQSAVIARDRSPEAEATICFTLGSVYYEQNQPNVALPWLKRTVELRPTADVWIMLSDCYEHSGDIPAALNAARRATVLAPDRPRYVQRLAELLGTAGNLEEAETVETRLIPLRRYRQQVGR